MTRLAMVIDLNKCVRCYACVYACIRENILRYGNGKIFYPPVENVIYYSRTRPFSVYDDNGNAIETVLAQCEHCEDPPCVEVCPTGASYISKDGVVLVDSNKCIQCGLCIVACPYGARTRLTANFDGEPLHDYALKVGIPDKCTFCYHRKTDDNSLWTPACVEACAFNARIFGDLDNPQDPINEILNSKKYVVPKIDFGTRPKVFYVTNKPLALEKYPVRKPLQEILNFDIWSYVKKKIMEPIVLVGTSLAVILGAIHIVREHAHEKREKEEVQEEVEKEEVN